ncbi:MAG: FAD-dependent monooxygenase, partial [Muribaculaceae bacterium]
MIKELQLRVTPEVAHDICKVQDFIAKSERIDPSTIKFVKIIKRSIDARKSNVIVNLKVNVYIDEYPQDISLITPVVYPNVAEKTCVIIVGAGPAGLFAALRLIELGLRPIIFERGKDVNERRKDLARIS